MQRRKLMMKRTAESSFRKRVLRVVSRIKRGETLCYKEVAELAGSPRAFRAVGNILSDNYDPKIPCHRVIYADGNAGNYNRGRYRKLALLKSEGTAVHV